MQGGSYSLCLWSFALLLSKVRIMKQEALSVMAGVAHCICMKYSMQT
ncbi:hypothetical protein [Sulfuracidifex metallicus]|nr:hypothetical protein [Sulfuracidifex metallicus]MCY0850867.1 hypothetical protein [Sulfuracidifex metallicus]